MEYKDMTDEEINLLIKQMTEDIKYLRKLLKKRYNNRIKKQKDKVDYNVYKLD